MTSRQPSPTNLNDIGTAHCQLKVLVFPIHLTLSSAPSASREARLGKFVLVYEASGKS